MANILLTQRCNQKCPYCFASYEAGQESITKENFIKAVEFITRIPGTKIGLLGGEPLLHPDFEFFCEYLKKNHKAKAVVVYTNGKLLHLYLHAMSKEKFALLINCNEKSFYSKEEFINVRNNIISAVEYLSTDNVLIGLNVYRKDMVLEDHVTLMRELGMHKIRLSLAIPSGNQCIQQREQFDFMRGELFRIFKILAEADILPVFDCCNIPMCYYSQDEITQLRQLFGTQLQNTNLLVAETACKPVLDIYPDLTVCRCFGYTTLQVNMKDFRNTEDISKFFFNKVDKHRFDGPQTKCSTCYLNATMNCMGGCMSYANEGAGA